MRISRNDFTRLLHHVTRAVESRNTIPILGHVKLVNKDGRLTATATDLDIEISGTIAAEGADAAFTVDAKMLAGIVGKLSGDTVDVEHDTRLTIKAGRSRFTLDTLPVDDFPSMQAGAFTTEFDVDLAALVAPVQFAISTEQTRFYLNGVYLHVVDGRLVAVATDGHRLSRNIGPAADGMPAIILPRKTVGLLPRGQIKLAVGETKVRITAPGSNDSGDITIISKVIDGTFPDYRRVIPTGNDKIVTFGNDDMIKAAGRVAVVSSDRDPGVRLAINNDGIELTLRGEGEATDAVSAAYGGDPIEIGFNVGYLGELVGMFPAGDVQMALADAGSPALFTSPAAEGLLIVLMPRRV